MLSQLAAHATEIKLTITAFIGLSAWLADMTTDAKGLEDLGLKGICILAVVTIGKLFLDAQKAHKAEMKETWDAHKKDAEGREAKLVKCIEDCTKATGDMAALTKEQTDYFKAVTRNIVSEKLGGPKSTIP